MKIVRKYRIPDHLLSENGVVSGGFFRSDVACPKDGSFMRRTNTLNSSDCVECQHRHANRHRGTHR
jgi:hypothetical protein